MVSRRFRLLLRKERGFFSIARRISNEYFQCFYTQSSETPQVAVLVSKKVVLLATKRNQVKRKVKNALQQELQSLLSCPVRVVIVVKRSVVELQPEETRRVVKILVQELCEKNKCN